VPQLGDLVVVLEELPLILVLHLHVLQIVHVYLLQSLFVMLGYFPSQSEGLFLFGVVPPR
jgi:hypothetical protein